MLTAPPGSRTDAPASPYDGLEPRAFWRSGVSERAPLTAGDLWRPAFPVPRTARIATAGSCFAQHVGRRLKAAGFNVLDTEPLPSALRQTARGEVANAHGFGLYSARYGNVYTVRQLLQLVREALGEFAPDDPVWQRDGRFYDALRPGIEPGGHASPEEVLRHRAWHLKAVARLVRETDILVFTFGLTEAWISRRDGTVYPTAPGTIAGRFDPERHAFHNFGFQEVMGDFLALRQIVMGFNPKARFIITVSPVPLTATASGQHVEVATAHSKAILRAVCGTLAGRFRNVDYFPSYEVITSQTARGGFYEANLRSVTPEGVEAAMGLFMAAHEAKTDGDTTGGEAAAPGPAVGRKAGGRKAAKAAARKAGRKARATAEALVCEEALLEAFNR